MKNLNEIYGQLYQINLRKLIKKRLLQVFRHFKYVHVKKGSERMTSRYFTSMSSTGRWGR